MFNSSMDEDEFFTPQSTNTNLASLFGTISGNNPVTSDLMYVAPKQPGHFSTIIQQKPEKSKPQSSNVILAKVVQVYKTCNNSLKIIGKYGLALVGESIIPREIMLYKDKLNILARATFNSNFQICLEDEFVDFYDNNNERWFIHFNETKHLTEFLDQLKKVNVKIVEILKQKPEESFLEGSEMTSSNVKNSNNEIVSQTRADILSRMAKMGQPILPISAKSDFTETDSTFNVNNQQSNLDSKNITNPRVNSTILNENSKNNNFPNKISQATVLNNTSNQLSTYVPLYSSSDFSPNSSFVNTVPSQEFNLFATETRMQNSEVRMNLVTLSSKIDNVLNEISKIKGPSTDRLENEFLKSKISDMENIIVGLDNNLVEVNSSKKYVELQELMKEKDQELDKCKQRIVELQSSLSTIQQLQEELNVSMSNESKFNQLIDKLQQQLIHSTKNVEHNELRCTTLDKLNQTLTDHNKELTEKIKLLQINESRSKSLAKESMGAKAKTVSEMLKTSMFSLYQSILTQLEPDENQEQNNKIKSIIASNIKQSTYNIIHKIETYLLQTVDDTDETSDNT